MKKIEAKSKNNQPLLILMGTKKDKLHSGEDYEQI